MTREETLWQIDGASKLADAIADDDPEDVARVGAFLILVAAARRGETVTESMDAFRDFFRCDKWRLEDLLREEWDHLRARRTKQ